MSGDVIPFEPAAEKLAQLAPVNREPRTTEDEIAGLRIRIWTARESGQPEEAARLFAKMSRLIMASAGAQRRRQAQLSLASSNPDDDPNPPAAA